MQDETTTIVALLHDVIEDSSYTFEDLKKEEFGDEVLDAIKLLTHDDKVPYKDYVLKIKENPIAKAVKLVDLQHNSDLSRLDIIDKKAIERKEKYYEAKKLLSE